MSDYDERYEDVRRIARDYGIDVPDDAVAIVVHESLSRGKKVEVLHPGGKVELREDDPSRTRVFALQE